MKVPIVTSRNLQFFVAGALFSRGFSAWVGFAWSLSIGSWRTALTWGEVGIALFMALGLLSRSRFMVRLVQIYLLLHVIVGIVIISTGGPKDSRYPPAWSLAGFIVGVCADAILFALLLWSTSKALTNGIVLPNQTLQPTARRTDE